MRHERQTGSHGSDVSVRPPQKSARRSHLNTRQDLCKLENLTTPFCVLRSPVYQKYDVFPQSKTRQGSISHHKFILVLEKIWDLLNQAKKNSISLLERSSSKKTSLFTNERSWFKVYWENFNEFGLSSNFGYARHLKAIQNYLCQLAVGAFVGIHVKVNVPLTDIG